MGSARHSNVYGFDCTAVAARHNMRANCLGKPGLYAGRFAGRGVPEMSTSGRTDRSGQFR